MRACYKVNEQSIWSRSPDYIICSNYHSINEVSFYNSYKEDLLGLINESVVAIFKIKPKIK